MSEITPNTANKTAESADKNGNYLDTETFKMRRKKNKKIWTYFDRISPHLVSCKQCKTLLSCRHTSANLVRHMYLKHKVDSSLLGADKTGFLNLHAKTRLRKKEAIKNIYDAHQLGCDPLGEISRLKDGTLDAADGVIKEDKNEISIEMLAEFENNTMNGLLHDECTMEEGNVINEYHLEVSDPASTNVFSKDVDDKPLNKSQLEEEKLRAETRYFHEMAALANAKRIMIELQTQKMRRELGVFDGKF